MTLPYLNPDLPLPERLADLLSRLTLEEKVAQMNHPTQGVPRLGIPPYNYWSEALHGVARAGRATVFPQAIGMAASWSPELVRRVASAIGDEGRAKFHAALRRQGETGQYQGLTFWSPNVNLFRDPRWGRGQETWGEDPLLTGEMGAAFVRGLQGDHPTYLKAAACAKHFAVHSGPEKQRHSFDARPSRRDLHDSYLPAFKKLVMEAKVEAVMGAYNRVYGEPACASQLLLGDLLRTEWGFAGHVVSDCGALSDFHLHHGVTANPTESAALALKMGCDLGCDSVYDFLPEALAGGLVSEAEIDRALGRTLATRFKLGLFDPPELAPYASIGEEVIGCPAHRQLAYEAALKSLTLLKNQGGLLPLGEDVRTVMLVGPGAASLDILLGNYAGIGVPLVTLVEGLAQALPESVRLVYHPGCGWAQPNLNDFDWSPLEAASTDLVIACLGLSPLMEGEEGDAILSPAGGDRATLDLPEVQVEYFKRMAASGTKLVLLLSGGSPLALGELEELAQAIVWIGYPGQEGGRAVADLLLGKACPSGKLPVSFPRSHEQLPPFEDYAMDGRTYRYASWEPLFPFGFGLSYTRFEYSELELSQTHLAPGEGLEFEFTLTNAGACAAEEVVQVYLSDLQTSAPAPRCALVAFQRVRLSPGESVRLAFEIPAGRLCFIDEAGQAVFEPGEFRLEIGGCSPGERGQSLGAPAPLVKKFYAG
jgi:beta-glucosidase